MFLCMVKSNLENRANFDLGQYFLQKFVHLIFLAVTTNRQYNSSKKSHLIWMTKYKKSSKKTKKRKTINKLTKTQL